MSSSEIRAYVPAESYRDHKEEIACPRFYEDFAILDPLGGYSILAARGLILKSGGQMHLPNEEIGFLEQEIPHAEMLAVCAEEGILLLFSALFSATGLLPVMLPHGNPSAVAYALTCMGTDRIRCSPSVMSRASRCQEAETVYLQLTETLSLCERVLRPDPTQDFRLHCAHIAQLSGCRANVVDLPVGHYPLHAGDHARWTAFLLCVFLSLRGDSALGSHLMLDHADRQAFQIRLSHQSEHPRKTPVSNTLYHFLTLPAFSNYFLTSDGNRFVIEAKLRRKTTDGILGAPVAEGMQEMLVIEIWLGEAC